MKTILSTGLFLLLVLGVAPQSLATEDTRPNIIWIITEDMSSHFSYQGETLINTPHVDRLAHEGAEFRQAYITSPVCSPSRSGLVTGMYPSTINAHHHRSFRGTIKQVLPDSVPLIPQLFKDAGYYVSNGSSGTLNRPGKTDYNFGIPKDLYDGKDWTGRAEGQPFFAQVQLHGGKNRGVKIDHPVNPADVKLPPQYPNDPLIREDWAKYLNSVKHSDDEVGQILARLENESLLDKTVIMFITDHGISHARGKQFCYEQGIHIPFIIWAPGRAPQSVRNDYVAHIDMAATSLYFAGIPIPEGMQSNPLYGPEYRTRSFVVSGRDRCDETVDRIRSVRQGDYLYIRNYHWQRPYLQPNAYKDKKDVMIRMRELHATGKLNAAQSLIMAESRPKEELYDVVKDPHNLHNLAGDATHTDALVSLRTTLDKWVIESGDRAQKAEPTKVYDEDMNVYVTGQRKRRKPTDDYVEILTGNIALMKQWASEGK